MKTQLLEDIGQSAALSLTSSKIVRNPTADKEVRKLAPAGNAQPAKSRPALGVWRQKPAGEPLISTTQQPDQAPTPPAFDTLFEEIAALEAQFLPPAEQHAPAIAPAQPQPEPEYVLPTPPAEPSEPAMRPADATLLPDQTHAAAAPQDPVFDFTPPSPALPAADPFTPARSTGSGQRYFLWAACLLALVMLIGGGRWWYEKRTDAGSPALIADAAKEKPQAGNAVPRQARAAKAFTAGAGDNVRVTPPTPAILPSPAVPPLVMLDPEPPAAAKLEQRTPAAAGRVAREAARKSEPAAKRAAAAPAANKARREPVRQLARASAIGTQSPSGPDTTTAALLRACRERGYHAAQCIKRGCSVTEYGFACRGR